MAVHKLQIDDFVTIDYELIAIHASVDDYRLAYFINKHLQLLLEKCERDLSVRSHKSKSCFSRYIFEDPDTEAIWNLLQNKSNTTTLKTVGSTPLFSESGMDVTTTNYILPEIKRVDYLLKVENCPNYCRTDVVIDKLLDVSHITTAYTIDHNKLKSKNNLIF